jgi:hypothetical protein
MHLHTTTHRQSRYIVEVESPVLFLNYVVTNPHIEIIVCVQ